MTATIGEFVVITTDPKVEKRGKKIKQKKKKQEKKEEGENDVKMQADVDKDENGGMKKKNV